MKKNQVKQIFQDYQREKIPYGEAKLLEFKSFGETFILEDTKVKKERDEWGNWHTVYYPIPLDKIKVWSSQKWLVEFVKSDVFPVGFRKIVPIKYLYSRGIDVPVEDMEHDLPEYVLEDNATEDKRIRVDKFIEIDGIECY